LEGSSSKKLPNISPPDPYDGDPTKSQSFLNSVNLYIEGREAEFATSDSKVYFAVSYMKKDKAKIWIDNLLEGKTLKEAFPTWDHFVKAFTQKFKDPLSEETARMHIRSLKQGNQTVEAYITAFETYEKKTGYDDLALKEIFEDGLIKPLQKRIYELPNFPTTLKEWKTEARKLDTQRLKWKSREEQHTSQGKTTSKPVFQPPKASSTQIRDSTGVTFGGSGEAMDIDAAKRQGLCFHCGQKGHLSRFCPNRKPSQIRHINMADMTQEELTAFVEEWGTLHGKKMDF
jgi:hypothetical protein